MAYGIAKTQKGSNTQKAEDKKIKCTIIPMLVLMLSTFMISNRKGQESIKETQKMMLSRLVKTKKFPGDQSLIAISTGKCKPEEKNHMNY